MIVTPAVTLLALGLIAWWDLKYGKFPVHLLLLFVPLLFIEHTTAPLFVIIVPLLIWLLNGWAIGDALVAIAVGLTHREPAFFIAWLILTFFYILLLKIPKTLFRWRYIPGVVAMFLAYITLLLF